MGAMRSKPERVPGPKAESESSKSHADGGGRGGAKRRTEPSNSRATVQSSERRTGSSVLQAASGVLKKSSRKSIDRTVQTPYSSAMPWEKQFDVDVALERAGDAFWSRGYEATSMCELLDAMGIQKGSFYATYGSKRSVYLRSLEQYADRRFAEFQQISADLTPLKALKKLLRAIYEECVGPDGHRGCMMINCGLELAHEDEEVRDVVQSSLSLHERLLERVIKDGQDQGEIAEHLDARRTAKTMLAIVIGMRVYARSGAPKAAVKVLYEQTLAQLDL